MGLFLMMSTFISVATVGSHRSSLPGVVLHMMNAANLNAKQSQDDPT
jgi:hypothetical protein